MTTTIALAVLTPAGHVAPPTWEHGPIRWPERVPVVEHNSWPGSGRSAPVAWATRIGPGQYTADVPGEEWSPLYLRGEDGTWWLAEIALVDAEPEEIQLYYATARYAT